MMTIIKAIEAVMNYAAEENERSVVITSVYELDMGRIYRVGGTHKAYRREYAVTINKDSSGEIWTTVKEVIGCKTLNDDDFCDALKSGCLF